MKTFALVRKHLGAVGKESQNGCRRFRCCLPIGIAALVFVHLAQLPTSQAAEPKIPAAVQQALEENAKELSPVSIDCTTRMSSSLSPTEAFQRLKMDASARPDRFFGPRPSRVVWQDGKVYVSYKYLSGPVGDNETSSTSEQVYEGKVYSMGSVIGLSKETIAEQKKMGVTMGPVVRNFMREPLATVLQRQRSGTGINTPYFQHAVGLLLESNSQSGAGTAEPRIYSTSAVLHGLSLGWKLLTVENTTLDGRRYVRIQLEGDNPIRTSAVAYDLDGQRARMQRNRETVDKQISRFSPQQKEVYLRSRRQEEEMLRLTEEQRKLPATRRYTYYLDPELHYAVKRLEQSYGPDTLLSRSDCSQFQKMSGRQLWLPKKVETQLHEFYSLPETIFKESFLSQVLEVSVLDGKPVPEQTFKLDDTQPGTMVRDATDPAAAKSRFGFLSYTIPAKAADLADVIERARNGEDMMQFAGGPPLASVPLATPYRSSALITIALCNVGLLGAGVAYVVWRRGGGEAV